jgi:hypothetical protein
MASEDDIRNDQRQLADNQQTHHSTVQYSTVRIMYFLLLDKKLIDIAKTRISRCSVGREKNISTSGLKLQVLTGALATVIRC